MGTHIPLGVTDFSRSVAETPPITVLNRYYEVDPTEQKKQVALLARPCLRKWKTLPTSPVRALYSQPGTFDEGLFPVAGNTVYKIEQDETVTAIGTLSTSTGAVSLAATDTYLFIADGASLKCYTENDYARGTLTATGTVSAAETIVIGSVHYKFVADVAPTADGSAATPWLVLLGGNTAESLQHLFDAIGNTGTAGTDYSLALTANTDAVGSSVDATTLKIRGTVAGTDGNSVATTETMANASWGAVTLAGGGGTSFTSVAVPDSDGVVSVAVILSFTICLIAQGQGKNGRFYWIRPGENTIQLLDFATAERAPDAAYNLVDVGDQFWIPGQSSNEIWYLAPEGNIVFQRQQGRLFDKGVWPGTVIKVKDDVMAIGTDGTVYRIADQPIVVSTPGIAQRLREAINAQRAA